MKQLHTMHILPCQTLTTQTTFPFASNSLHPVHKHVFQSITTQSESLAATSAYMGAPTSSCSFNGSLAASKFASGMVVNCTLPEHLVEVIRFMLSKRP